MSTIPNYFATNFAPDLIYVALEYLQDSNNMFCKKKKDFNNVESLIKNHGYIL